MFALMIAAVCLGQGLTPEEADAIDEAATQALEAEGDSLTAGQALTILADAIRTRPLVVVEPKRPVRTAEAPRIL